MNNVSLMLEKTLNEMIRLTKIFGFFLQLPVIINMKKIDVHQFVHWTAAHHYHFYPQMEQELAITIIMPMANLRCQHKK